MFKPLLATFLTGALFLSACGGSTNKAENTGKAMAETACLLFQKVAPEDIEGMTNDIMKKYGYSTPEDIDTYLTEIRDTADLNKVSEAARTHLDETCADDLTTSGVNSADLAEAMVAQ